MFVNVSHLPLEEREAIKEWLVERQIPAWCLHNSKNLGGQYLVNALAFANDEDKVAFLLRFKI